MGTEHPSEPVQTLMPPSSVPPASPQRPRATGRVTLADVAAAVHLPLVSSASKIIYGQDCLADLPVRDYLKRLGERPAVQQVNADRKANTELMMARMKAKS